jgi:hypothetical protein
MRTLRNSIGWWQRAPRAARAAAPLALLTVLQVPMCVPLDSAQVQFQALTLLRQLLISLIGAGLSAIG